MTSSAAGFGSAGNMPLVVIEPVTTHSPDGWRECMAVSGYGHTDVWAADNDIRRNSETPLPVEITTAEADVTCRRSTKRIRLENATEVLTAG